MAKKQSVERAVLGTAGLKPLGKIRGTFVEDEDQQLAASAGQAVVEFLKGLAVFFTTAKALEQHALQMKDAAQMLTAPTNAEEDLEVQRFVKRTSESKRDVEAHWKITATISNFHRRMTARRAKATDALEIANSIGNKLHNQYVEAEKRRAAAEQERLRREAEDRALAQREAELAEMERQAIEREEASGDLSERERLFVEAYTTPGYALGDGQKAAQRAGYREPLKTAARLLSARKIQEAIAAKQEAQAIRSQAAARREAPVDVEVEEVRPNIVRAAGAFDRSTHAAELLDEAALIKAILAGTLPAQTQDLLRIDPTRLNEYARSLKERINEWPGVRYKRTTKVV
jgi:hypothetical protein